MNVLYDIAVLGYGHSRSSSRTGVFRVVEEGAKRLLASDRCAVNFCTSQSNHLQCNSYLATETDFSSLRVGLPEDLLSRLYGYLEPARMDVHNHSHHILKNDLVRFLYHTGRKFTRSLASRDIDRADIYHSPSHAIPRQILDNRRIVPFLTIHDIGPMVYDDLVSRATVLSMQTILASITPETFVLCVSHQTRNELCNYLPDLDPERVTVTHLAAGDHFYQCTDAELVAGVKARYGIPAEGRYLLALSTLIPRKNFSRTIRCFVAMLRESRAPDLYLVLVGDMGFDSEDILGEIERAGDLRNRIIMTGYLPDADLAPLYSDALAFVYLSIYEGFGLPPLEAMQCGTAVISSNRSSLPEVVGDAAIMVDPLDDAAICQAMLDIYRDDSLRAGLVARSLQRAQEFSWHRYHEQLISAYQRAL
jgi:glycosyltransferase involved in cell wall biosynthesis